jgi:hypothetical protein
MATRSAPALIVAIIASATLVASACWPFFAVTLIAGFYLFWCHVGEPEALAQPAQTLAVELVPRWYWGNGREGPTADSGSPERGRCQEPASGPCEEKAARWRGPSRTSRPGAR